MDQSISTVLVAGGKYADRKVVERALNYVHSKHQIRTLITGAGDGAEEMAYWWAAQKPIPTVITIPKIGHDYLATINRFHRIFTEHRPQGILSFAGASGSDTLHELADKFRVPIWSVPDKWQG